MVKVCTCDACKRKCHRTHRVRFELGRIHLTSELCPICHNIYLQDIRDNKDKNKQPENLFIASKSCADISVGKY